MNNVGRWPRFHQSKLHRPIIMADDSNTAASSAQGQTASTVAPMELKAPHLPTSERVDKFLGNHTKLSRSTLQRLFELERILVNGTVCKKNYKVCLSL